MWIRKRIMGGLRLEYADPGSGSTTLKLCSFHRCWSSLIINFKPYSDVTLSFSAIGKIVTEVKNLPVPEIQKGSFEASCTYSSALRLKQIYPPQPPLR